MSWPRRGRASEVGARILCLVLLAACGGGGPSAAPSADHPEPRVEEPPSIPPIFFIGLLYQFDNTGYRFLERFFGGRAHSYVSTSPLESDGRWRVAPAESADYQTRMVVFRPVDPADFNGTVLVEWLNVSGGIDAPADWILLHDEIVRRGYAWVGVSAQQLGVEGGVSALPPLLGTLPLKEVMPKRYGSLVHPGDSFSYDIFAQAAEAIRHPVGLSPLGDDLSIRRMIAVGESQSAARLVTFVNAFGKSNPLFDGYFIHSRVGNVQGLPGASAPLSQQPQADIVAPSVVTMRDDLSKPIISLQTETDLFVLGAYASRQDDGDHLRLWEVAGASHADINSSGIFPEWSVGELYETKSPAPFLTCPEPVNSAPQHHFVAKAGLNALNRWIVEGLAPALAPRLAVDASGDGFEYDALGNVLGGIRSPYVDVPTARLSGESSVGRNLSDLCFLFGVTQPFDDATLRKLYPDHDTYVSRVARVADDGVANGFLLPEDARIIVDVARSSDVPPP